MEEHSNDYYLLITSLLYIQRLFAPESGEGYNLVPSPAQWEALLEQVVSGRMWQEWGDWENLKEKILDGCFEAHSICSFV